MSAYDTETFQHDGRDYVRELHYDESMGPPWNEHDGHGCVSEWTRRSKAPGELVLCEDRGSKRFYDFAEAVQVAKRDGWDALPYNDNETSGQKAAKAARADFEHLRQWCADLWHWCGVVVRPVGACHECGPSASVWGIESTAGNYFQEVAEELCEELCEA